MIARLTGKYSFLTLNQCILDVKGVGYHVFVPIGTAEKLRVKENETITLSIHTAVREDAIQLYGFKDAQDKFVFSKLISVSGIGPKIGLAVLSEMRASQIATAIMHDDLISFTKISGIGKKTGQRLLLELKSKLDDIAILDTSELSRDTHVEELTSALLNLGYKSNLVDDVVRKVRDILKETSDFETMLKKALQLLN